MSLEDRRPEEQAVINQILHRSATDADYRRRLLADPNPSIEEVIGVPLSSLPKPFSVKFVEKDPGLDALIVLPDLADPEGVLSEAELEAVAGGDGCWWTCVATDCIGTK